MGHHDERTPKSPHEKAAEHLKKILRKAALGGAAVGLSGTYFLGCDPAPTPICERSPTTTWDFLNAMYAPVTWQARDAGGLVVHARFELTSYEQVTFAGEPLVSGGTVSGLQRDERLVEFDVVPNAGTTEVHVVIEMSCAGRPDAFKVGLDVSKPHDGASIMVTSLE
ncbi:MAG TPA: hypothetical protein VGK67_33900 [Myxococcales bacterium]|jgi:hypothetical protein